MTLAMQARPWKETILQEHSGGTSADGFEESVM
jgi:hypothetical protein